MSVRLGILTVLTLGKAYGLQVHGELESRMNRTGRINVGQIYSTIDRLQAKGLVRLAGTTTDGLPLYDVTDSGREEVEAWLGFESAASADWQEMVEHVLMASSIPGRSAEQVILGYQERLAATLSAESGKQDETDSLDGQARLGALAERILAEAGIRWLDAASATLSEAPAARRGLAESRPRRGRRPA